jgi:aspartokinase/homoserine dehydrogenase 1
VLVLFQGSSERGIGLWLLLMRKKQWLSRERIWKWFYSKDVNKITVTDNVSVISIIGQDLSTFTSLHGIDKK